MEKINAGGHLFVLSDKPGTAARFRREDAGRRAELAFAASFHSGGDLGPMRKAEGLSLGARAVPAALADFSAGVPEWAQDMLVELTSGDLTLANLYFRTMMEEAPTMTMLEAGLTPEMLERAPRAGVIPRLRGQVHGRSQGRSQGRGQGRSQGRGGVRNCQNRGQNRGHG